ncbi:MAG TPA: 2-oxoglutarate and iron-dependent oxygenase domain-containing protein [Trebonia sp.]|nr:2-oxoglutarate and iron-dependent oxygenase domain-containing protein [Trebonia sp.]
MTKHVDEPGRQHTAPDRDPGAAQTIPVLRLDTARRVDETFDEAFLAELRAALHGIGFLQLTGYGATPGQVGALTAAAARFFALPLQERLRLAPHFPGYTRLHPARARDHRRPGRRPRADRLRARTGSRAPRALGRPVPTARRTEPVARRHRPRDQAASRAVGGAAERCRP